MGQTVIDLLIVAFFVLVNAFFSGTEMAVISLNDAKIRKLAEEGDKNARKVVRFIDHPATFLATIQVGVTLAGFLSSAFAANSFASKLAGVIDPNGAHSWVEAVCTVVITIVLAYFSLVLGELVPKRVAQKYPEKWAYMAASIVRGFGFITKPFVKFLTASTNAVLFLLKIDPNEEDKEVTEEEIRMMVDVGSESGNIEETEKDMIENIFEFNDKEVSEIMTHRKKLVSLPDDVSFDEAMKIARNERYTRIPIYHDTIDDIVGILHIKDLLGLKEEEFDINKLMREPLVVHDTRKISSLFNEMKTCGMQLAVVIDEYGGTMGICTIEDMLEEIVGNITDEFDDEEQSIIKNKNGDYVVAGDTTLSDLEDVLEDVTDIKLDDEEYDTIAGLVIQLLDRVPEEKEHPTVKYKNLDIRVLDVQENWISKVLIHINPINDDVDEEKGDKRE
ncbi:MAG: hemolysin family protein [Saccharofermentans sp.]|nr:hemolysin family protein [Saccharofermentans sp.]